MWARISYWGIIPFIVFIAYWPSLHYGFIHWDDYLLIVQNPLILGPTPALWPKFFTTISQQLYIPLTLLSFDIEHFLAGLNPTIFHFDNIILHAVNSTLIVILANRLSLSSRCALIAGLLFALHPAHIESIVWVSQRKDLLYALFYLLAILSYIYYKNQSSSYTTKAILPSSIPNHKEKELNGSKPPQHYLYSCFILGMMSLLAKPTAFTLPLILCLIDFYLDRKLIWSNVINKIVLLLLMAPIFYISLKAHQTTTPTTVSEQFLTSIWSFAFYLKQALLPLHLSPIYRISQPINLLNPHYVLSLITVCAFIVSIVLVRHHKILIYACLFFLLTMGPLCLLSPNDEILFVSDHQLYLGLLGFCLGAGYLIDKGLSALHQKKYYFNASLIFLLSFSLLISHQIRQYIPLWGNEIKFWQSIANEGPHYLAYNNLGHAYSRQNDYASALKYYTLALGLKPDYDHWIYGNIAMTHLKLNQPHEAIKYYTQSLQLNPYNAIMYLNRGSLYDELNQLDAAFNDYNNAINANPTLAQAYYRRSILYYRMAKFDLAIKDCQTASKIIPNFKQAINICAQLQNIKDTYPNHKPLNIIDNNDNDPILDPIGFENYIPHKNRFKNLLTS